MLDITFDSLLRAEAVVERIGARLQDHRRFWTDFVAPFTYGEIDDILTLTVVGFGRTWIRYTRHAKPSRIEQRHPSSQ